MSYGVNRAKKRTTRRRPSRGASAGRARAAGKSKRRGTSTKRATSARRAASGRTRRKAPRRTAARAASGRKRTTKSARKPRAKKAKLYTRYDPETGAKVRVYADSFEYANWLSRKPSKKRTARAALLADPLGTTATAAQKAAIRAGERIAEHTATRVLRTYAKPLVGAALGAAAELGGATLVAAVLPVAAALGGALLAFSSRPGAEENQLSVQFVQAQNKLIQESGGKTWMDVPESARTRLLNDYKAGLQRIAQVRAATTVQYSNRYRKG